MYPLKASYFWLSARLSENASTENGSHRYKCLIRLTSGLKKHALNTKIEDAKQTCSLAVTVFKNTPTMHCCILPDMNALCAACIWTVCLLCVFSKRAVIPHCVSLIHFFFLEAEWVFGNILFRSKWRGLHRLILNQCSMRGRDAEQLLLWQCKGCRLCSSFCSCQRKSWQKILFLIYNLNKE